VTVVALKQAEEGESAAPTGGASLARLQLAAARDPMPPLPPQTALPNSLAMVEFKSVASVITQAKA
jgi:hypothetical protein